MAVVRKLLKNDPGEFALLRHHPAEPFFGVQLADRDPRTAAEGARLAASRGARFVDLNCGCPTHDITGKGLGASLLRKPRLLGRLVEAMARAVEVPVTVKLRSGWSEASRDARELAHVCQEAGAAALTVHGRSREQRYTRAADWALVGEVASRCTIPVVGNGDILTHYEAEARRRLSGVTSLMVGRGALIKPWVFREIAEGRSWEPTASERLGVLWRFRELLGEYFGEDERGRRRMAAFLPWHLDFLARYRPLPESRYAEQARQHPLLQTRFGHEPGLESLEQLLRDPRPGTHAALAAALLDSASREEAEARCQALAAGLSPPDEAADAGPAPREVRG